MALQLRTERQVTLIVNSFKKVFETGDIDYLTKAAYKYIHIASGFIAHYNLHGFRCRYRDVNILANDILMNKRMNQWSNFHKGYENYEYMMQKKEIYNKILEIVEKKYSIKPSFTLI